MTTEDREFAICRRKQRDDSVLVARLGGEAGDQSV